MYLLSRIKAHLRRTGIPHTRFGRDAVRDPRLVHDMRNGRTIGPKVAARVIAHIERTRP